MSNKKYDFNTIAVRGASQGDKVTGAISFPIYQSSTFKHPGLNESTGYDYSRLQNPTREELEKTMALLEGGKEGLAFATGLAAMTAIVHLFKSGDHVIISEDLYGGTFRLFNEIYKVFGVESTFVDTSELESITAAIRANTKAVLIETPSNPSMRVSDIAAISKICKDENLLLIVDNTFLTPYFQRPLDLGADIVVHSGTKYLGGHNDLLAGILIAKDDVIIWKLRMIQKSTGGCLSSFDAWLLLRGLKTLHIRLEEAQKNAFKIAAYLSTKKCIEKVYYIGLKDHKGYEINKSQSAGYGGMISFRVTSEELVGKILGNLKLIAFAESLGGVESLITYPFTQTHSDIPDHIKRKLGVDEKLLRLSVGIENVEDLINDLESVLED